MAKGKGIIWIDTARCKGCGLCIQACPTGGIGLVAETDPRGIRVASSNPAVSCTGCGMCYVICPDVAITVFKAVKDAK